LYAGIDPVCRPGIVWLAADDPEGGRRALRQVMDRWSLEGFHYQHYLEMFAENQIDLYQGNWARAWRRVDERWPALKASFLLRIPFAEIEARHLRARAALAATIGSKDNSLLDRIDDDAKRIVKVRSTWSHALSFALRAGVANIRGRVEEAAELLDRASRRFERAEMMLYAKAAAFRRAQLIGGDGGRELRAATQTWFEAQGVKNVPRLADVLVPGFHNR
jgi:hypothetical protein